MTATPIVSLAVGRNWPTDWPSRHAEYARRRRASLGLPYTESEIHAMGLFRATNTAGQVIQQTTRVLRDVAFICRTNSAALAAGLSLGTRADSRDAVAEVSAVEAQVLGLGMGVWRRSRISQRADEIAWTLASLGDLHLEPSVDERGGYIVAHRPEHVEVYYDPTGTMIEQARVKWTYTDPPGDAGIVVKQHTYERILTATEVITILDGVTTREAHTLGVVPWVHVPFQTVEGPEFSAGAGWGFEDVVAIMDSALTQLSVIGSRHANPWLLTMGAILAGGEDPATVGKVLNLPAGADAKFLEAALQGLTAFVDGARLARESMTSTCPEFLFADAGASASGTSLSYRASQFKGQVEPIQVRFRAGLADAVGMAVCLQTSRPFVPERNPYEVTGSPALAEDRSALAELIRGQLEAGLLLRRDAVARLQGIGLVPDGMPPEEYAAEAEAEQSRGNAEVVRIAQGLAGGERQEGPMRDDDMAKRMPDDDMMTDDEPSP